MIRFSLYHRSLAFCVAATAASALAPPVSAQLTATSQINATLTVIPVVPIVVTPTSNLQFGSVNAGTSKTVSPSASGAGSFTVSTNAFAAVNVTFVLPSSLQGIGAAAGSSVPISFGPSSGSISPGNTAFNPGGGPVGLSCPCQNNLFIGGTVTVPLAAPGGDYSGTIVLNAAYVL